MTSKDLKQYLVTTFKIPRCLKSAIKRTDKNPHSAFLNLYLSPLPSYPDHSPLAPILPSIQMSLIRNSYANN